MTDLWRFFEILMCFFDFQDGFVLTFIFNWSIIYLTIYF